jgi:hypothetical protein
MDKQCIELVIIHIIHDARSIQRKIPSIFCGIFGINFLVFQNVSMYHPICALCGTSLMTFDVVSRNSRTEAIAKYTTPDKRVWKLPTSTQLRATWHTDSLDMVVLPSTGVSRYQNCCVYGGISPEYLDVPSYKDWIRIGKQDFESVALKLPRQCVEC